MSCGKLNSIGVIGYHPTRIAEIASRAGKEGLSVHVGRAQGKTCSRELEVSGVYVGREKSINVEPKEVLGFRANNTARKQKRQDDRKIKGKRKYGY